MKSSAERMTKLLAEKSIEKKKNRNFMLRNIDRRKNSKALNAIKCRKYNKKKSN